MKVAELRKLCMERGIAIPAKATKAELVGWLETADLNTPIEVAAETVEDGIIQANTLSIDPIALKDAAVGLTSALEEADKVRSEMDADPGTVADMKVSDIRICEDAIAAAIKEVDAKRLELTRMLTEPKKLVDSKCKELTEPLREMGEMYAESREAVYMRGYEAQYHDCCISNGVQALVETVPFDRFIAMHPRWTARTANPVKTQEKIAEEVERIAKDWATLQTMRSSMRFYDDAEIEFFNSLDVKRAIERNNQRTAEQERIDAMNREREENERWMREQEQRAWSEAIEQNHARYQQAQGTQELSQVPEFEEVEPEPAPTPEPPAEPARAPQVRSDGRRRYHFEAWMTDAELASFREWKNACGVGTGWTFREVQNG